jgi:hypothetical protein
MHRLARWVTPPLVLAAVAAAVLVPGTAGARSRRPCSPSKGSLFPRLLAPCNHTAVPTGRVFTFKVRDMNPNAHRFAPYINLSRKPPKRGVLKDDTSGDGLFAQMKAVRGHRGLFQYRPKLFHFPGYWLVTPGRYFVQIQQIDCTVKGCHRFSPVETITVR